LTTAYHSKHLAHLLTLRGASDSLERLTRSIADARVDLNPHQVDAALFAFRSPLSRGCILADEVGLGKTIEAGIVMSQRWAERRRRILLLVPAAIRRQWQAEMEEKFYLPVRMLDSEAHGRLRRGGEPDPFDTRDGIVVCSYHFAARRAEEIQRVGWDLVVMDEAHRLRNVYKPQNRMARSIKEATAHAPKLMLTATPLQNSLMELYGLVSVIDDRVFGDERSFRERFVRDSGDASRRMLRSRLGAVCTRTLRSQVQEYIRFTRRVPLTQEFTPTDEEQRLYEGVSEYLSREKLLALPNSQRALITLVLRKLLASSTFAIAGTLRSLVQRLEGQQTSRMDDLLPVEDYEALDELADELETETPNEEARPAARGACPAARLRGACREHPGEREGRGAGSGAGARAGGGSGAGRGEEGGDLYRVAPHAAVSAGASEPQRLRRASGDLQRLERRAAVA
jgi:adenine-specific DNA-methyltransferase